MSCSRCDPKNRGNVYRLIYKINWPLKRCTLFRHDGQLPSTSDTWITSSLQKAPLPLLALYILSSRQLYTTPNSSCKHMPVCQLSATYCIWKTQGLFHIPLYWQQRQWTRPQMEICEWQVGFWNHYGASFANKKQLRYHSRNLAFKQDSWIFDW